MIPLNSWGKCRQLRLEEEELDCYNVVQVIQTTLTSVARDGIRFMVPHDHSGHSVKDTLERDKPVSGEMKLRSHHR